MCPGLAGKLVLFPDTSRNLLISSGLSRGLVAGWGFFSSLDFEEEEEKTKKKE